MSGPEQPYVGGQAVIEGVMMRAPRCMAIAVRRADGTIVVREDNWISIWERWRFLRWPGFRGAVILAESVYNGLQALNFAADQAVATEAPMSTARQVAAEKADANRSSPHAVSPVAFEVKNDPHVATAPGASTETTHGTNRAGGARAGNTTDAASSGSNTGAPRAGNTTGAVSSGNTTGALSSGNTTGALSSGNTTGALSSGNTTGALGDGNTTGGASGSTAATMAASFAVAIGLFVGLPHLLAWGTGQVTGTGTDVDAFSFHLLDGLFKLAIFIGYIYVISFVPEIRRVFQYHGAEHKVVNVYENGLAVTLDNARRFTTFHARCGTSFVLFVLVLSIFMFAAIFPLIPRVSDVALMNHIAMIFIKIPLMFPLAGLAYEINRYAARHPDQWWVQLLVGPGRMMQRLTTREPDDDQLEIAIAAMRAALRRETAMATQAAATAPSGEVVCFKDFQEVSAALPPTAPDLAA